MDVGEVPRDQIRAGLHDAETHDEGDDDRSGCDPEFLGADQRDDGALEHQQGELAPVLAKAERDASQSRCPSGSGRGRATDCLGRLPAASQGTPRKESATTHAAAVSAHDTTVSLRWDASLEPAATTGTQTSSVNAPICNAESTAASRAHTPMRIATPAAM